MEHLEMTGAKPEAPGIVGLSINELPDDMIINIFNMLDFDSLWAVAKVCTRWQQLCMTPYLWKYRSQDTIIVEYMNYVKVFASPIAKYFKKVKLSWMNASQAAHARASLISCCPNLTHLYIITEVDSSIFDDLHKFPNLQFLYFYGFQIVQPCGVDRNSAKHLPFHAKNVKYLTFSNTSTSEAAQYRASLISYCPNLTHMEIESEVDTSIFDDLHHLPNLEFLSLKNCSGLGDRFAFAFDKLKYLETLILPRISLPHTTLYSILQCKNLVNIDLRNVRQIPEDFLESLVRNKQSTLRELRIHGSKKIINDELMRHLSNCEQLQVLSIKICYSLSDSSLLYLSGLKDLHKLRLFHGNFSRSAMLEFISNNTFHKMTSLTLPIQFPVTPQAIEIIKTNAPNLKEFYTTYDLVFKVGKTFEKDRYVLLL